MTKATEVKSFQLADKHDEVKFDGWLLAFATTETDESVRWTEVSIYRTTGGQYVIHRAGRSVVYHVHGGSCNSGVPIKVGIIPDDEFEDLEPCTTCNPMRPAGLADDDQIDLELDRFSVDICGAGEVAQKLRLKRGDGSEFISQVASRALMEAIGADPELHTASIQVRQIS